MQSTDTSTMKKLKILDLFSGIGGFSLGLEATGGFETAAFCDIDPYCRNVLKKHWPNVPIFEDIKKLKGTDIGTVDIITGGYPCQPFSVAGKQKGVKDKRHLWPEYFRLVKECRPTWVIGENVSGHIKLGLDSVIEDLESQGYATRTFSISASSIGANHKRERIWIVANSDNRHTSHKNNSSSCNEEKNEGNRFTECGNRQFNKRPNKNVANAYGVNDAIGRVDRTIQETGGSGSIDERRSGTNANGFSQSSKNETLDSKKQFTNQNYWKTEPNVGRVVNGVPNRVDRLKALGNSLIPQIPFYIGQTILRTYENNDTV
jgi:DNA (cytosine-5)-methyltransferase 1